MGGKKLGRLARAGRLVEYLEQRDLAGSLGGWLAKAQPLRGWPIVTYHKTRAYIADRFGFTIPLEIEEKPGIPPSAGQRDHVLEVMRSDSVRTILLEILYDRRIADYLAEKTGATVAVVPIDVGEEVDAEDYFDLIDTALRPRSPIRKPRAGDAGLSRVVGRSAGQGSRFSPLTAARENAEVVPTPHCHSMPSTCSASARKRVTSSRAA